ncbi:DUF3991 and TOPRIM domain-containing protein [Nostoc sp. 2RC]|uniref:DUF3991 and TOPRIM domain-containing protein n=1 Tax=Nostoc sp. 2RC TaxID=2485484 RepID=UPI0021AB8F55|nr:DUF3991 and TOPRIM domain-containing protein [Nostoc sp. 2RC]
MAKSVSSTTAIDLVMHVQGCNFKEAIATLNDRFGESLMERAVTHHAKKQAIEIAQTEPTPQFVTPVEDETNWQAVHNYLTQKRGLPSKLVQHLHTSGLVYADSQQNAVFLMRGLNGETTGAFLRGTRGEDNTFMGYATGTKRTEGWFYIRWGGQPSDEIQRVVLCKSPVDALSFAMLEAQTLGEKPQQRTMYMAVDSSRSLPVEFLKTIPTLIAAYNRDDAGNEMAQAIKPLLPYTTRMRPKAADWNEELLEHLWKQEEKRKQHRELERD